MKRQFHSDSADSEFVSENLDTVLYPESIQGDLSVRVLETEFDTAVYLPLPLAVYCTPGLQDLLHENIGVIRMAPTARRWRLRIASLTVPTPSIMYDQQSSPFSTCQPFNSCITIDSLFPGVTYRLRLSTNKNKSKSSNKSMKVTVHYTFELVL